MIAVIAETAEKKSSAIAAIIAIIRKRLSNDRWDIKGSISVIVVAVIAGKWFPYDRYQIAAIAELFFFLSDHSDRSDHMQNRL